jgi:DNA repair protein RecO (recombination protein O)
MLQKTRGIVLNYLKFRETSIIVKIYTEALGIQTYILANVRSAKSKTKVALYQPLTLLDLVVYYRKDREQIFRIAEAKCAYPYQAIPFEIRKTTVILFLAEILGKTLKEEASNPELFDFLFEALKSFDQATVQYDNFHLRFLLRLSRYLGFEPQSGEEILAQIREHKRLLLQEDDEKMLIFQLDSLIQTEIYTAIPVSMRREILDYLLDFYRLHIANFDTIRSLEVLREISR